VDIPIITWRYEDPACQGVWMRAERLNGKYDFMRGFSTTAIGEKGMIEVLGEGGDNLFWEGRKQHLVLHREGRPTMCFRFDEGGDDVWESEISYYGQGHINQVRHFVDCVANDARPRYGGEDGAHAVQCTLATIRSAEERRPVRLEEIEPDYSAYQERSTGKSG
jgi:predicted dehydrogenase